jgi:hypothetical protein
MKLFQISLPRTRSSMLFDSTSEWQIQTQGLYEVDGHPELFLEVARNIEFVDRKVEKIHTSELYPVIHEDGIKMHYIYPLVFNDVRSRNQYKINLLKQEKARGREYLIKGTLNMAENCEEVLEFFKDRKIVLTTREDREAMIMSFFYAWESKLFQSRHNNLDLYKEKMSKGVVVDDQIINSYIPFLKQYEQIESYLKDNNIPYTVITYEQLENSDTISELVGTDEWKKYVTDKKLPIHIEKDYRKLIHNYDEVKERLVKERVI